MTDATSGVGQATVDLQGDVTTGGGPTVAAADFRRVADQIEQDVSTLPSGDKLRSLGDANAKALRAVATALTSNSGLNAAVKDLNAPGDAMQTQCRAVEP